MMNRRQSVTFYKFSRQLRVYFYTSSVEKLAQARCVFERAGCRLFHYIGTHEPYDEDYASGTENLLNKAIRQITGEFGIRGVFFVEDTSLRIEALSEDDDFPGVSVKEWFASTSFGELDKELRFRGLDRRATIKSDIALHIPTLERPIFFHGETSGVVAETPPEFLINIAYPWLTPRNFNGWFIPDGDTQRLGQIDPERSLEIDFRARCLRLLLDRLYEYDAITNLDRSAFLAQQAQRIGQAELRLGLPIRRVFLVVGRRCAGKTTFGDFFREYYGAMHLEASALLREVAAQKGVEIAGSGDARAFLEKFGFDVVAREVCDILERMPNETTVITGLRTIEEVIFINQRVPDVEIIAIEADVKTRFFRHIRRARDDDAPNIDRFQQLDVEQEAFGLLSVMLEVADRTIVNNGMMLGDYLAEIQPYYFMEFIRARASSGTVQSRRSVLSELSRCLLALERLGRAATCKEIQEATATFGTEVRRYNTNRALKAVPELAKRLGVGRDLLRYELTSHGHAFLRLLRDLGYSDLLCAGIK